MRKTLTRFALTVVLCSALQPAPMRAYAPEGWHSVDPGFTVEVLLGRGTAMWAAGSGESIAVSTDAGLHWVSKHHDPDGALLLTLRFVDQKFGYAAGTGGTVLFTEDGGESWTAQKLTDETILQAAFGDAQHGVVRTISALKATTDGGKSWHSVVPASDPDWLKKYPVTNGMVALDQNWMTVQLERGPNVPINVELLWTKDGGVTWNTSSIENTRIYDLFVAPYSGKEAIFAAGYEGVTPMSFREVDGAKWDHIAVNYDACHWPGCGGYTGQGYFAGKNFMVLTEGGKETLARIPERDVLTNQWARSGKDLCVLSGQGIECTTLETTHFVTVNPAMPQWEQTGFAGIGRIPRSDPQCIRCDLQTRYTSKTDAPGEKEVQIAMTLGPSGHVVDAKIGGGLPDEVAANIRRQAMGWLFERYLRNGDPAPANLTLRTQITLMGSRSPLVIVKPASKP